MHTPRPNSFPRNGQLLRVLQTEGSDAYRGRHQWSNHDLDPTPPQDRKWTRWDYAALWWGSSFNANSWAAGSSLVSVGLSFSQAMGANIVASAITSVASVANARQGALYHIGYPVAVRSQMGVWGAYFFVFMRAIVAIVWFGIQSYYTGRLFSVALRCIFGHHWMDMKPFPPSAGITSQDFTAFIVAYLLQLPLVLIHPAHMRRIFEVKAWILPPCAIGLTAWTVTKAGGFARFDLATRTMIHGAQLGWTWMACINSVIATFAPMIINQPDLARYARRPEEAGVHQGIAMFLVKNVVTFCSIATTSALKVVYGGPPLWNLWDQLSMLLDHEWTGPGRFAVCLVALIFAFATTLTNISANSLPFGADITGIAPRWLNIRRGQVACWFFGLAIVPWKFLVSATKFITFLGSYTILMGAILGVVFCDFFVVRRGNIHIPSAYSGAPDGLYYFWHGVNWRGALAWLAGFAVPFPGLVGSYKQGAVSATAVHMYDMGWILSVSISFGVHYVLNRLWPVPIFPASHAHITPAYEYLGDQRRNGVFDDERWTGAEPEDAGAQREGKEVEAGDEEKGEAGTVCEPELEREEEDADKKHPEGYNYER